VARPGAAHARFAVAGGCAHGGRGSRLISRIVNCPTGFGRLIELSVSILVKIAKQALAEFGRVTIFATWAISIPGGIATRAMRAGRRSGVGPIQPKICSEDAASPARSLPETWWM
jgi:hypothetical protein